MEVNLTACGISVEEFGDSGNLYRMSIADEFGVTNYYLNNFDLELLKEFFNTKRD